MNNQKKKQGRKKVPYLVKTDRLKKLIDKEKSRQVIADSFGCDVSTITKHYNGDNPVDLEMLYYYAKYFNVSTDYLLGLTDVASTDKDTIGVCKYIGISEKPIKTLKNFSKKHGAWRTEKLLESLFGAFEEILNG